ncbi:GatB domain-containing protein, partial [Syncephalis pseudoplumigaleata]
LRCDVNVSVHRPHEPLGVRCELKNLTSIRFLMAAIDAEVARQIDRLASDQRITQETRGYDAAYVDEHRATLPELPDARKQRFMRDYGLSVEECNTLFMEPLADVYFEQEACGSSMAIIINIRIVNELMGRLNGCHLPFSENPVSVEQLRSILVALHNEKISGKLAKKILQCMIVDRDTRDAEAIAAAHGWSEIRDASQLEALCRELVANHADEVEQVRQGNKRLFGWFV